MGNYDQYSTISHQTNIPKLFYFILRNISYFYT